MSKFEPNTWVWIQDETEKYLPAKVLTAFSKGTATTVQLAGGENRRLESSSWVSECNPEALNPNIQDLINISDLNEMSILHNLRTRFKDDRIYTNISSILISVNPFKNLPLYTPQVLDSYREGFVGKPPHVYGVAYTAYNNMLNDSEDQSVVCSGESGAGKSEATKLILQFMTEASAAMSQSRGGVVSNLGEQILAANPILEAFGNAKTLRNNNSSRFGKLITINFDQHGCIIGGGVINYLLEKSRVVFQNEGERNYHIFYQVLSTIRSDPALARELRLDNAENFEYVKHGVITIEGVSDEKEFEDVRRSYDTLNFAEEEKQEVYRIIAGVLHFGNVVFNVVKHSTESDSAAVADQDLIRFASSLWGVDPVLIEKYLCGRDTLVMKEVTYSKYSVSQAQDARDALTKRVYGELFQRMVDRINFVLSLGGQKGHRFIGILDIFGFESFEVNSFEQLCINFCNEKLQFHFNEHIFRMEQALYQAEGIIIPGSAFVDNQPTLDLLELARTGIFSLCDEELVVPKGSDEGFLTKVFQKHGDGKHPNCIRPKGKDCKDFHLNFGILHYAGPVYYKVTNFLEKNKDQLHPDLVNTLRNSTSRMISSLFPPEPSDGKTKAKLTLGSQFKAQLNSLIATLNTTHPHFVRCMKSNDLKTGNNFNAGRMLNQLRYAGLLEVCRIRKLGFPVRRPFDEFYKRYRCCSLLSATLDDLLDTLRDRRVLKDGEWAKGTTKIFMRMPQSADLELAREQAFLSVAVKVQKVARGYIYRSKYKRYKLIIKSLASAIEVRNEAALHAAVESSADLPWKGVHLEIVRAGKDLYSRVKNENRVLGLLKNALAEMELNALKGAINAAASMDPPFMPIILTEVRNAIKKVEGELAVKNGLLSAISSKNLVMLEKMITQAQALKMDCNELHQAITLKTRMEEENSLQENLIEAIKNRNLDRLNYLVKICAEIGVQSDAKLSEAQELIQVLLAERAAKAAEEKEAEEMRIALEAAAAEAERQRLELEAAQLKRAQAMEEADRNLTEATAALDFARLNDAIQKAMQLGISSENFRLAIELNNKKGAIDDLHNQVRAAMGVLKGRDGGVGEADIIPLRSAIARAVELDFLRSPEVMEAKDALALYEKQIEARSYLSVAIASKDRKLLRRALDAAENLDIELPEIEEAKDIVREIESSVGFASGAPTETYAEAEESRTQRREVSKQARFEFKNFSRLRSPDDFARGAYFLQKLQIRANFLQFQDSIIIKSLTEMNDPDCTKLAIQMHKELLGYMGDRRMPFPAMLAQDILNKGFKMRQLRDEIYLQIIKQLTANPRPDSVIRGWQMLSMCVGSFPPSYDFERYLLHFLIKKRDTGSGAAVEYAKYCLRTLETTLSNGDGTGFIPTVEEILAYKERPPILATIYLVDGSVVVEDLPVSPDFNVGKVIAMCARWLDLRDTRVDSLGIFAYDWGPLTGASGGEEDMLSQECKDLIRTPIPLKNDEFMGDTFLQLSRHRKISFVLKKKFFFPRYNYRGEDKLFEQLMYMQAFDETIVQGNIDFDDETTVVGLAALSLAIEFGPDLAATVEDLVSDNVTEHIVPSWKDKYSPERWAASILPLRDVLVEASEEHLRGQFVRVVQENFNFGMSWYYVLKIEPPASAIVPRFIRQLPHELLLGFNWEGLHLFTSKRALLVSMPFSSVVRWVGAPGRLTLILAEATIPEPFELAVATPQAPGISTALLDHILAAISDAEKTNSQSFN